MQLNLIEHGMNIKYIVELNEAEREFLLNLISKGNAHVVLDNLNTHNPASLYKTFNPQEASGKSMF